MFPIENARCCLKRLFLPCRRLLPLWWVVFRVVAGKLTYYRALCRNAVYRPSLKFIGNELNIWVILGQNTQIRKHFNCEN